MTCYCKTVTPSSQRGYALPGVLAVSTMISFLVLILVELHQEVIFLARDTKEILLERNRPTDLSEVLPDTSECTTFTAPPTSRLLCKTAPRVFKTYPRIPSSDQRRYLDFNTLFLRPDACSHATPSISSVQGRLPTSPLTCNVREHSSERIIIRESLYAQKIFLLPNKNRSAALLASLGDIQIESQLILSTDSVIVAAGSIRIKGISSSDGGQRRVTLIAHSGDISIQDISATIFPLLFGRSTFTLPSVRLNPPYPMVIERKQPYISGIMLIPKDD